ncbi:MAG: Gfo/Idh/MocA family protein [Eubacteriales bacterium]
MKIVIIGGAGHYNYIIPAIKRNGYEITGLYFPNEADNLQGLISALDRSMLSYKVFDNYNLMLDETKPDIAVVNTIFSENGNIAAKLLRQGIHVFCEKPLASDFNTLDHLKNIYQSVHKNKPIHLAGMFGLRYNSVMKTVKHAVDEGLAGNILLINAQKSYKMGLRPAFYSSRETYGGLIPWVAIHGIDWIYWLTDKRFVSVSAAHTRLSNNNNGDMETAGLCTFELEGGIIASVTADMMRPQAASTHGDDRIRIVGDRGVIEAVNDRAYFTGINRETYELPLLEAGDIFEDFCNMCLTGNKSSLTAESSLYVTGIALTARESADTGKVIYF